MTKLGQLHALRARVEEAIEAETERLEAESRRKRERLAALRGPLGVVGKAVHATSLQTGIPVQSIIGRCRKPPLAEARQIACWAAFRCGCSYSEIARQLKLNHKTVMHSVAKVEHRIDLRRVAERVAGFIATDESTASAQQQKAVSTRVRRGPQEPVDAELSGTDKSAFNGHQILNRKGA